MTVFSHYARYYDLLYRDKNYVQEAQFVTGILKKWAPGATSLLELGCGTALHAGLLAERGYSVHGVDMSQDMLDTANERVSALPKPVREKLTFSCGDARTVILDAQFDAVISLFHVMSYQVTNDDLSAAFRTARTHLKAGGLFVFDCWYGPAVLTDRPTVREKKLEDAAILVHRLAEPVLHPNENIVDVNYTVSVQDKVTGSVETIKEKHRMRYLFKPELDALLSKAGFSLVESREWLTNKEPGYDTWGVYFVARA